MCDHDRAGLREDPVGGSCLVRARRQAREAGHRVHAVRRLDPSRTSASWPKTRATGDVPRRVPVGERSGYPSGSADAATGGGRRRDRGDDRVGRLLWIRRIVQLRVSGGREPRARAQAREHRCYRRRPCHLRQPRMPYALAWRDGRARKGHAGPAYRGSAVGVALERELTNRRRRTRAMIAASPANTTAAAPATASGAPNRIAAPPRSGPFSTRMPCVPKVYAPITRPRISFGADSWIFVLVSDCVSTAEPLTTI